MLLLAEPYGVLYLRKRHSAAQAELQVSQMRVIVAVHEAPLQSRFQIGRAVRDGSLQKRLESEILYC